MPQQGEGRAGRTMGVTIVALLLAIAGLGAVGVLLWTLVTGDLMLMGIVRYVFLLGVPLMSLVAVVGAVGLVRGVTWGWRLGIGALAMLLVLETALLLTPAHHGSPAWILLTGIALGYLATKRDEIGGAGDRRAEEADGSGPAGI